MQSLVYQLNQKLQAGYIAANLEFVRLILHGGPGIVPRTALRPARPRRHAEGAREAAAEQAVAVIEHFVQVARVGFAQTGTALKATANPITLTQPKSRGRTWVLSAQVQAYGIAVTVTFLALLLAAGAAAAEKDEGTIGRLRRGLVSFGQLVWAKARSPRSSGSRSARRSRSSSASSWRSAASPAASRGRGCRCCSSASRSSAVSSARSACCSARSRARPGRRRCSQCSSCSRRLPRNCPARRGRSRVLDQPVPPVRPRRPLVRRRPLRHRSRGGRSAIETLWLIGSGSPSVLAGWPATARRLRRTLSA